jgi:transposase-like protein
VEPLKDPRWVNKQYWDLGRSSFDIAEKLDVDPKTVTRWMDEHGIERRSVTDPLTDEQIELLTDNEWIHNQYHKQNKSTTRIANEVGVSRTTLRKYMNEHGIARRSVSEAQLSKAQLSRLEDAEWLHEQYYSRNRTTYEIAEELGVSDGTVGNWMDEHDIDRQGRSEARTDGEIERLKNPEWLREQYCERKRTTGEIADQLDVSSGAVSNWMDQHGIDRRDASEAQTNGNVTPLNDPKWLYEQYCEKGRTTIAIAEELNITDSAVGNWMDRHGIDSRGRSEARTDGEIERLKDSEWLREQYCKDERSGSQIAEELSVHPATVYNWMDEHGIDRRSLSEARSDGDIEPLRDPEWLRNQYCEKEHTLDEVANMLDTYPKTVYRYMERHGIETRFSEGSLYRPDDLDHPVRSGWEHEIATRLTGHGIEYRYEQMEINYGNGRTYTPDFVTSDFLIEVKGRLFESGSEEQKARAAMNSVSDRQYVVVGTKLPADVHIAWEDREELIGVLAD